jgi:hypothetical protein
MIINKEKENNMSDRKDDEHHIKELREMIKEKDPKTPIEKVLTIFCERHSLSQETCRSYYNILANENKIKEK